MNPIATTIAQPSNSIHLANVIGASCDATGSGVPRFAETIRASSPPTRYLDMLDHRPGATARLNEQAPRAALTNVDVEGVTDGMQGMDRSPKVRYQAVYSWPPNRPARWGHPRVTDVATMGALRLLECIAAAGAPYTIVAEQNAQFGSGPARSG
jgi:hypothetical protein